MTVYTLNRWYNTFHAFHNKNSMSQNKHMLSGNEFSKVHLYVPVFSLGQVVCGENPMGGFMFGATTATPATLFEPFFNFIMTDLFRRSCQSTDLISQNECSSLLINGDFYCGHVHTTPSLLYAPQQNIHVKSIRI